MTYGGPAVRAKLCKLVNYVALETWLPTVSWKSEVPPKRGHYLVQKITVPGEDGEITQSADCIVVGRVSKAKLFVGPSGDYNPHFSDDLEKSKFRLTLTNPKDEYFGDDFAEAIRNLSICQDEVAATDSKMHLIQPDGTSLRFSAPMFELRVSTICRKNVCMGTYLCYKLYSPIQGQNSRL